jgi:UDP-N-acetylmuramyl pentapeptide phosphotransferase/UDP-N-acetylglucosamine-1-phosphate transferase
MHSARLGRADAGALPARLIVQALAPVVAFLVTAGLLRVLLLRATCGWFLDQPNQRSLHAAPVPRTGGLGIVPGIVLGLALAGGAWMAALLAAAMMILSLVDDWRSLPAGVRLLGHLAAAGLFVLASEPGLGWPLALVLVVAIGWMTNLFNFMDGADGLAGGMAVFGFTTYAIAACTAGETTFALANLCVAAAAVAFLLFNFPPARMFMGDAGSVPLGFLAAALGLSGWQAGLWPWWFPPVVFAPFVLDASVTLIRRALRGERVWQAHRSHYYQRQVLMGWSHRQLAWFEYGLMLVTALAALSARAADTAAQAAILAMLVIIYVVIGLVIDLRWRARKEA